MIYPGVQVGVAKPFGRLFAPRFCSGRPRDLALLIDTRNGVLNDRLKNGLTYSAAVGNVPDGLGGVQSSAIPPVHADGFYGGPAYTNIMPVVIPENLPHMSVTQLADEWFELTKLNTTSSTPVQPRPTVSATERVLTLEILAGNGTDGTKCSIGLLFSVFLPITFTIQSGPGLGVNNTETLDITALSTIIPTVVRVNNTPGVSNQPYVLLYAGGVASTQLGASVKVRRLQVTAGPYQYPYIPPATSVVSTVGTSTGNGLSVPLSGSTKADRLIECFRGVPDGVEMIPLAADRGFDSDTGYWFKGGEAQIASGKARLISTAGAFSGIEASFTTVVGQRYLVSADASGVTGGGVKLYVGTPASNSNVLAGQTGRFTLEFTATLISTVVGMGRVTGACDGYFDNISIQKLTYVSGTTVACLVKMGVNNNEPPDNTPLNVVTANNIAERLLYSHVGVGSDILCLSSDSSNFAYLPTGTWDRSEYHLKIVETGGGKFRVGHRRYTSAMVPIDADIVWSHATLAGGAAFDGSFNPLTFLRFFYTSTVPNWLKMAWVSNKSGLGNTEILRRLKYAGYGPDGDLLSIDNYILTVDGETITIGV